MNKTLKRILIYSGIGLDAAVMVFLLVVAIIMLSTMPKSAEEMQIAVQLNGPFIGTLQANPTLYFCTCVLPLILLFIANIVGVVIYVKKHASKKAILADLNEAQKEALRAELLKEMSSKEEDKK